MLDPAPTESERQTPPPRDKELDTWRARALAAETELAGLKKAEEDRREKARTKKQKQRQKEDQPNADQRS